MINYDYKCNNCGTIHQDVYRSIKDKPQTLCQVCGQNTLESIIYGGIHVSVEQEPKTLNQLAERNTKKMGKYEIQSRDHENELKKKSVQLELSKLGGMNSEQKQRYILDGKK